MAKDKPVTPLSPDRPPGTPAAPNPSQAVPDKAPASVTDLSAGPKQVNERMAQADVTEEQLKKGNEPEFDAALGQKKEMEEHSATAPGHVRASEAKTLEGAKAEAATTGAAAMSAMAVHRVQAGQRVGEGQQTTKGSDESKRAQVTAVLQKVFDATKSDVEGILSGLDRKVDQQFDAEEGAARRAFEADMQKRMDAYKSQRYGGFMGKLRWVKDQFMGLPPEANQIFVAARDGYVASMRQVISRIADTIGAELTRAKARIAQGRADLEAEVHKLPADLQTLGQQAAAGFEAQFDELNANVDAKGQELVQTLADKYTEALEAVDAEIDEEKAKNQGLVSKAIGAIQSVIQTIIQLENLLMGVLAKAAQAVTAIIKDPIGFLGHLVSAVGAGLRSFMANIADHLKKGLVSWLMGAAAQAGIQLPDKFDLEGIVQMIASLLGLTWQAIRGRIVSRGVPDQAITAAEQAVPEAQLLAREGLPGLWRQIVSKIGDLKSMILGRLTEFLIPTVLVAGITQPGRLHVEPARLAESLWRQAPRMDVLSAIVLGDLRWSDDPFVADPGATPGADELAALLRKHMEVGLISLDPRDLPYGGRPVLSEDLLAASDPPKLGAVHTALNARPEQRPARAGGKQRSSTRRGWCCGTSCRICSGAGSQARTSRRPCGLAFAPGTSTTPGPRARRWMLSLAPSRARTGANSVGWSVEPRARTFARSLVACSRPTLRQARAGSGGSPDKQAPGPL